MIIDSHTHIGSIACFHLSEHTLIDSMRRYGIDFAIVSNLEGIEYISPHEKIERQVPQMDLNRKALVFVRAHADILRMLFWIKPNTEGMTEEARSFISANREHIAGLKIHPFHSLLHISDERYLPYLDAAREMRLPIEVHTSFDEYSRPSALHDVAARYPEIDFIMVHMGLGTDNSESIDLIRSLPNLYGDTTWVSPDSAIRAVRECGSRKILFGTDSPIDGSGTYERYAALLRTFRDQLTAGEAHDVLCGNALRIFFNGMAPASNGDEAGAHG